MRTWLGPEARQPKRLKRERVRQHGTGPRGVAEQGGDITRHLAPQREGTSRGKVERAGGCSEGRAARYAGGSRGKLGKEGMAGEKQAAKAGDWQQRLPMPEWQLWDDGT